MHSPSSSLSPVGEDDEDDSFSGDFDAAALFLEPSPSRQSRETESMQTELSELNR